ncbi:VOC family protein [Cellulomonas sp. 179-A 4D5 NHS]|uniref:VOC family protein n=1 Tax=Cellulomonas sp. 179-A 4D5 NHS TaxID=3142378 RepID=UPI00399F6372
MGAVRPHLWFHDRAGDAAAFYAATIPNTSITSIVTAPPGIPDVDEGATFIVELQLDGMPATFLNAGPSFTLDEAFSFYLTCDGQEEVDHYWEALAADGGQTSQCGWLRDRFGVSWQVVPRQLDDVMSRPDKAGVARATAALMQMTKIDVATLEAAYSGELAST